jgi:O-antigen ligase
MSSLGVIVCLVVVLADGLKQSPVAVVGCVLNAILVAGSQSLSAQLVCAVSVVMVLTVGRFIRAFVRFGPVVAGLLLLGIIFVASTYRLEDFFELLGSLGKDPTLSSRVPLWQSLAPFMMERFWLGFGYEAFWSDSNYAVQIVVERVKFRPWYAHNGVVELWLGLGMVGLALMIFVFLRLTTLAATRLYQDETNPAWQLALVFAFQFLVQNFSESTILMRNSMFWSFLVMLAYMLGSSLKPTQKPALATTADRRRKIIAK